MRWNSFIVLCCFIRMGFAQVDTLRAPEIYQEVRSLYKTQKWQEVLPLAKKALQKVRQDGQYSPYLESNLLNTIGDSQLEIGLFSAAILSYRASKRVLLDIDNYDRRYLAEVLNKIGNYYVVVKEYPLALAPLDTSLQIRNQLFGDSHLKVADVYINLGNAHLNLGDAQKALDFQLEAWRIRSSQLPSTDPLLAQNLNNLGQAYQDIGDRQKSIDAFKKSISIYNSQDASPMLEADVHLNLGNVYLDKNALQEAVLEYRQALVRYDLPTRSAQLARALCYNNIANVHAQADSYHIAFQYYQKALELRKVLLGEHHPDIAETLFNMGLNHLSLNNHEKAINHFERCRSALQYDPVEDPTFTKVNDHQILLFTLYRQIQATIQQSDQSENIDHLLEAFSLIDEIDMLLDYLWRRYASIGSKLNILAVSHIIYDQAIELALSLYKNTLEEKYWHFAFKYAEKSKGLLLLEALQKTKAASFLGIPDHIIEDIKQTEVVIGQLEKRRYLFMEKESLDDTTKTDTLDTQILINRQLLVSKIDALGQTYPAYFNLRYETTPPSINAIQLKLLKADQTIVTYFLGSSKLWIFVINVDDFQVRQIDLTQDFSNRLEDFDVAIRVFPHISSKDIDEIALQYTVAAHTLYNYLIKPIKGLLRKKITIIPDDELGYLSYGALLSDHVDSTHHFRNHPYLVKDHIISYNYSIRLLQEMSERKKTKPLLPYLGMAPTFHNGTNGLAELKFNTVEVEAGQEILGGRIATGDNANKASFLEQQDKYKIIHLATHGKARPTQDDYSFLAFSARKEEEPGASLLYAREIFNLSTNAEVIVLSACETATGTLNEGEGIASIARSFSYAGAKSLIATRWNVNDKTTMELINGFLSNLKAGKEKDLSFHESINDFVNSNSHHYAHPFYWASFMAIGNMEAVDLSPSRRWPYVTLLMVLLLLVLLAYLWHHKRNRNAVGSSVDI